MSFKRILCVLFSVLLVLSFPMSATAVTNADTDDHSQSFSTYKQFEAVSGSLPEIIRSGRILNAWNCSYKNITDMLETISKQGFGTIQVSPPHEVKMPTKGIKVVETSADEVINGWWMFYQVVGFQINQSEDNALGTKNDFVKLCEEADKYGIKIIAEVVVNNMANNDDYTGEYFAVSENPMDYLSDKVAEFESEIVENQAFHTPYVVCEYLETFGETNGQTIDEYAVEESLTQHATSLLWYLSKNPDLATESQIVQDAVFEYLSELVEAGADGFYFREAKNVETDYDTHFASDFWNDTLERVRRDFVDVEVYAYGEILDKCGDGREFSEYTDYMDVTDTQGYWGIYQSVSGSFGPHVFPRMDHSVIYNESADIYTNGYTSALTFKQRNKIWALLASRKDITSVYFARPTDETARNRDEVNAILNCVTLGDMNVTAWANPEVMAVNQFGNFFSGAFEHCTSSNRIAIVERYDKAELLAGATIVNLSGLTKDISFKTANLPEGTYIDSVTGNTFVVKDNVLKGRIGETGIACIYYADDERPVFPIYFDPNPPIPCPDFIYQDGVYPVFEGYNTIVFSIDWDEAYIYAFSQNNNMAFELKGWPGVKMKFVDTNEYGEKNFVAYIPVECNSIIFHNGKGLQLTDIIVNESIGIYCNKYNNTFGSYTPVFVNLPYKVRILGDADCNGTVNVKDATAIQKNLVGLRVERYNMNVSDADSSGRINIKDATTIQKWAAGLLSGDSYIGRHPNIMN